MLILGASIKSLFIFIETFKTDEMVKKEKIYIFGFW